MYYCPTIRGRLNVFYLFVIEVINMNPVHTELIIQLWPEDFSFNCQWWDVDYYCTYSYSRSQLTTRTSNDIALNGFNDNEI